MPPRAYLLGPQSDAMRKNKTDRPEDLGLNASHYGVGEELMSTLVGCTGCDLQFAVRRSYDDMKKANRSTITEAWHTRDPCSPKFQKAAENKRAAAEAKALTLQAPEAPLPPPSAQPFGGQLQPLPLDASAAQLSPSSGGDDATPMEASLPFTFGSTPPSQLVPPPPAVSATTPPADAAPLGLLHAPLIDQPPAGPPITGPPDPNHQPTGSSNPSGDEDATLNGTDSSPPLPNPDPPASGPEDQLTGASTPQYDTGDPFDLEDALQMLRTEEPLDAPSIFHQLEVGLKPLGDAMSVSGGFDNDFAQLLRRDDGDNAVQPMDDESTFEQPTGDVPSLEQHQLSQDAEGSSQVPGHANSSSQPSTTVSMSLLQPKVDAMAIKGDRTLSISFVDRAVLAESGDRVPLDVLCVDLTSIEMWPKVLGHSSGHHPSIPNMIDEEHGFLFGRTPLLLEPQCYKMVHLGAQFINGLVANTAAIASIWLINRKDAGPQVNDAILQKLVGTLSTQWAPMPYEQWLSSVEAVGADGLQAVDHKGRMYGWGDWMDPDKLAKKTEPPRGTPLYVSSTFESARLQLEGLQLEEGSEEVQPGEEASPESDEPTDTTGGEPPTVTDADASGDSIGTVSADGSDSAGAFVDDDELAEAPDTDASAKTAARGDHLRPADSVAATPTVNDGAATQAHTAVVGKKTRSRLDDACTSPATIGNGVEVEASNIKEAGRGLFARGRSFAKGDLVTEYSGTRLKDKMEAAQRVVQTHILHCSAAFHGQLGNDIYIDGDRVSQHGGGGASFANHKPKMQCNAEFVYRQIDGEGKVFLQATAGINDGDEIFAHCGSDLAVMMGEKRRELDGQSTRTVPVPWGALHMRGFEVFEDALRLDEATKVAIKASPTEAIFNGKDGKGGLTSDGRRLQTTGAPEWTTTVTPRLDAFLRTCDVMRCSQGEKILNKLVALSSRPRASKQKKHQPRHADSAARNSLRNAPSEDVPLACIVALQDGTRLHVWPFDTDVEEIITLNEGDAILFRGDLGHAGSEYDEENWRLHIYIDSPVIERAKEEDGTPSTFPF